MRYDGLGDPQVLISLLIDNAFLIVLGVGMTFVILTGGIDLSVGSVVALSTMIAAKTLQMGWSPYLSIAAVLVTGTVLGLLMGLLIHYFDIQPFIATLAGLFLARGLTYLISVESISISDDDLHPAGVQDDLHRRLLHPLDGDHRAGDGGGRGLRPGPHPLRPHGLRHRRQRELGDADGPAGGLHQGRRLRHQRLLRRARRPALLALHPLRQQPARRSAWSSTPSPRSSSAARC